MCEMVINNISLLTRDASVQYSLTIFTLHCQRMHRPHRQHRYPAQTHGPHNNRLHKPTAYTATAHPGSTKGASAPPGVAFPRLISRRSLLSPAVTDSFPFSRRMDKRLRLPGEANV